MIQHCLQDLPLPVYGRGENVRDWIHVEDHCNGIESALFNGLDGHVYNFEINSERKNIDLVRELMKLLKSQSQIEYVTDRLGHDFRYAIDNSKAQKFLGWSPKKNI